MVSNSKRKKVNLKYCLNTLNDNEPEEEVKELIQLKEEVHAFRMVNRTFDRAYEIANEDYFYGSSNKKQCML